MLKAKVTPSGRMSLPAELRKRYGLTRGGQVLLEDRGDAIVLRTLDQAVAHAQAASRRLVSGVHEASVDDFLSERAKQAASE